METSIHEHCELKSYSIGDIKPVELVMINRDKPLSYFRVSVMMQAAEFITLCNLSVMTLGDSASTALQ